MVGKVVLRDAAGRWVWWEGLYVVDYLPARKRRPSVILHLDTRNGTEIDALRAIALHYASRQA